MGDRIDIIIKTDEQVNNIPVGIGIYSHWFGSKAKQILSEGLLIAKSEQRWDDYEYCTRIIFTTFEKYNNDDRYGLGLFVWTEDKQRLGNDHDNIIVDLFNQVVHCEGQSYSFDRFIEKFTRDD